MIGAAEFDSLGRAKMAWEWTWDWEQWQSHELEIRLVVRAAEFNSLGRAKIAREWTWESRTSYVMKLCSTREVK